MTKGDSNRGASSRDMDFACFNIADFLGCVSCGMSLLEDVNREIIAGQLVTLLGRSNLWVLRLETRVGPHFTRKTSEVRGRDCSLTFLYAIQRFLSHDGLQVRNVRLEPIYTSFRLTNTRVQDLVCPSPQRHL